MTDREQEFLVEFRKVAEEVLRVHQDLKKVTIEPVCYGSYIFPKIIIEKQDDKWPKE